MVPRLSTTALTPTDGRKIEKCSGLQQMLEFTFKILL